jgi:hypothetical protein
MTLMTAGRRACVVPAQSQARARASVSTSICREPEGGRCASTVVQASLNAHPDLGLLRVCLRDHRPDLHAPARVIGPQPHYALPPPACHTWRD